MLFQIIVLALVLGLIAYLALEGAYTATIMAVCAIFAAAVALNYFEPLGLAMLPSVGNYAYALALAMLFLIPMAVFRIAADKLLPGMVHLPYLVDRIGGGVIAVVPALIMGGLFVLIVRLMPLGPSLIGYHSLTPAADPTDRVEYHSTWLNVEGFATGLFGLLSDGSMSTLEENPVEAVHPDWPREIAGFASVYPTGYSRFAADALEQVQVTGPEADHKKPAVARTLPPGQWPAGLTESSVPGHRLVELTIRPKSEPNAGGVYLAGGQAQLHVRPVNDQGVPTGQPIQVFFPSFVRWGDEPMSAAQPIGIESFLFIKSELANKGTPVHLVYVLPETPTLQPTTLVYKSATRVPVHVLGDREHVISTAARQPAAARGSGSAAATPASDMASVGQWPVESWKKFVTASTPVTLSVRQTPQGAFATGGRTDAPLKLTDGQLLTGVVEGDKAGLSDAAAGTPVIAFAAPPGTKLVQIEGAPTRDAKPADLARLRDIAIDQDGSKVRPVGLAAETAQSRWLIVYDATGAGQGFDKFDPAGLAERGGTINRIVVIAAVPASADRVKLQLGDDRVLTVFLR